MTQEALNKAKEIEKNLGENRIKLKDIEQAFESEEITVTICRQFQGEKYSHSVCANYVTASHLEKDLVLEVKTALIDVCEANIAGLEEELMEL